MFPVRYGTGELAYSATDLQSDSFSVPWGHTRSFANRLSKSDTIGQGFNWQVEQWPYFVRTDVDQVAVLGPANTSFWFDKIGDEYVSKFNGKHTFMHDDTASVYRFFNRDGSYIEFDDVSGMFERHVDAAGNKIEVTAMHANTRNFTEVERTYTTEGSTTTEQYHYEYTNVGVATQCCNGSHSDVK